MQVGLIKEVKDNENRVALTPEGAWQFTSVGHKVKVERGAGLNSGFPDQEYERSGCAITGTEDAWDSDLILKIKEPLPSEYRYFKKGQFIFTYFHLAGVDPSLTDELLKNRVTAIAYETVRDSQGKLPLLAPMSAVAGMMSISVANHYLARVNDGRGVLLGSILGQKSGKVVIFGDGTVGQHAAFAACGIGARTFLFTRHEDRVELLKQSICPDLHCVLSSESTVGEHLRDADAVIGAVLLVGAKTPHIVSSDMVESMRPGSVVVDVSIDQGGCIETSRPTSHTDPVYKVSDVTHYCVTNMPAAYPVTSTVSLTGATLPYALRLANEGLEALRKDQGLSKGVNTYDGSLTNEAVAESLGKSESFTQLSTLIGK